MNVCKSTIAGLAFLLFSFSSFAQEAPPKKMKYGIGMGLNYSQYYSNYSSPNYERDFNNHDPLIGFSMICTAERTLSNRFKATLRPEIAFLGSKEKMFDAKTTNVNVVIPISLHGRVVDHFYVHGGVGIEYVAGISSESEGDSRSVIEFVPNRWIPSVHTGVSYVVSNWVDIGIKYNYGLGSIQEFEINDFEGDMGLFKTKNSYYQFSVIIRQ